MYNVYTLFDLGECVAGFFRKKGELETEYLPVVLELRAIFASKYFGGVEVEEEEMIPLINIPARQPIIHTSQPTSSDASKNQQAVDAAGIEKPKSSCCFCC